MDAPAWEHGTGETSLHIACEYPKKQEAEAMVQLLLGAGADVSVMRVKRQRTRSHIDTIQLVTVEVVMETPLHIAIRANKPELVVLLIANGADLTTPWKCGEQVTPIMELSQQPDIIKALTMGWTTETHHFYPLSVRQAIKTLLLCAYSQKWNLPRDILLLLCKYTAQACLIIRGELNSQKTFFMPE